MTTFWTQRLLIVGATSALLLHALPATAADPLWEPRPVPARCPTAGVHMLLEDVSGSMKPFLGSSLEQQARYIEQAPDCLYVIYGEFGLTARVVVDGFLTTPDERARLAAEIRSRPRTQSHTNFDEAGALVELTLLKVERAYSEVPWSFTVSVISDRVPSPSEGHEPFDLQAYLLKRRLGSRVGVLRVELVADGTAPTAQEVRAAPGRLKAPVGSLTEVLQAVAVPVEPAPAPFAQGSPVDGIAPLGAEEAAIREGGRPAAGDWSVPASIWAAIAVIVLLIAMLVLLRVRRSGPAMLAAKEEPTHLLDDRVPRALRITEQLVDTTGEVTETVRDRLELPVAVSAPVVFATDPNVDVPLRPVPGVFAGRVVTITPQEDGQLRIKGAKGLKCNGAVVPRVGAVVDATTPVRLELADRRWQIVAIFSDAARVDDLLAAPRRTALAPNERLAGEEVA